MIEWKLLLKGQLFFALMHPGFSRVWAALHCVAPLSAFTNGLFWTFVCPQPNKLEWLCITFHAHPRNLKFSLEEMSNHSISNLPKHLSLSKFFIRLPNEMIPSTFVKWPYPTPSPDKSSSSILEFVKFERKKILNTLILKSLQSTHWQWVILSKGLNTALLPPPT